MDNIEQYIQDIQNVSVDQEIEILLDRIIDEIKENEHACISFGNVDMFIGFKESREIIEKYKEIIK